MARGKKRTPRPRNEGSVASSSGPTVEQIADMPAEQHGDRTERVQAQQQIAAGRELASSPSTAPGPAAAPGPTQGDVPAELGRLASAIFADTQRPDEPLTAGAPEAGMPAPPILPDDPDLPLRALFAAFPHPDIAALLEARRPNTTEI